MRTQKGLLCIQNTKCLKSQKFHTYIHTKIIFVYVYHPSLPQKKQLSQEKFPTKYKKNEKI